MTNEHDLERQNELAQSLLETLKEAKTVLDQLAEVANNFPKLDDLLETTGTILKNLAEAQEAAHDLDLEQDLEDSKTIRKNLR